jgi:uncharacterized repeat protein (TIGR01451 family)
VSVSPSGGFLYVTSAGGNTTSVVSAATNASTGTIPVGAFPTAVSIVPVPPQADIAVSLTAQAGALLPGGIAYTVSAQNNGPAQATGVTVRTVLPTGASATNLGSGCTAAGTVVTCTYASLAPGATGVSTFRSPLGLLGLGTVTATATRTASAPTDPQPANDSASASCTVVSVLLARC